MAQFNADPNKPGWGTYVNDQGQAAYDYFPNIAPQVQALNPSAAAPLNFTGGTPDAATGGAPNVSAPPESNQSVQPDANMSVAPPSAPEVPVPAGVHPLAGKILGALNAATKPAISDISTTTAAGRPKAAVARDTAALGANLSAAQSTNTQIGAARQARTETAAQGNETAAMSQALTGAGELSKNLGEQAANNKLLSDSLAEKDPAVNPRRLIQNLSTGGTILTTVLAALGGGFSAVAGQKTNPALDAINSAIDQDIDSQKTEIESGRIRRGNLIQAYRERGMKLDQAETAARATITDSTRRYAEAQAQELGAAANSEDAQLLNQGLQTQYTQQVQALNQSGEQRSTTTVERKTPPGAIVDPVKRMSEIQDAVTKMRKNGAGEAQIADFLRTQKLDAPANPPAAGAGKFNRTQTSVLAANEDITAKLKELATLRGTRYDPTLGQVVRLPAGKNAEGYPETHVRLPNALSKQNAQVRELVHAIASQIALVQNVGQAPNKEQIEQASKGLLSDDVDAFVAAANQHLSTVSNIVGGVRKFPGGAEVPGSGEEP